MRNIAFVLEIHILRFLNVFPHIYLIARVCNDVNTLLEITCY